MIGLGNPGPQYALNRHNIGFMILDIVADHYSFAPFKCKGDALISEGALDRQKVLLLKPLSFMNLAGIPSRNIAQFYKIPLEDIFVFQDDLDIPLGKIKGKKGGGSGGHNGIRSLDSHLGKEYWRIRIGIGHPGHPKAVSDYVLENFTNAEQENYLIPLLQNIVSDLHLLVQRDIPTFLNNIALRKN